MSLLSTLFTNAWKQKPTVNWFSISTLDIVNATSLAVFYEFYERNPYIAAVIGRIESDVGSHWFEIRKYKKEQPLDAYKNLIKASIWYTPRQFIKRIIRDFEVTGNAYVYLALDGTKVTGLQILDPRYIKPVMKKDWTILWYVQTLNWVRAFFLPEEIHHLRWDTDLKYECVGRSKMESLFIDLETDKEARDSNLAFFRNNQTPASVILLDPDYSLPTDAAEAEKVKKKLKEVLESGRYSWGKNRHRASVWEWVKWVVKVQDKISDMEFINTRKFTLDMVCAVYEVNKDILWITETSNKSVGNVQSETYYFRIEEKEKMIDEFMTGILQACFWPEYSYVTLQDNIRTLTIRSDLSVKLFEKGVITRNEAREILQYDPVEWWDEFSQSKAADQQNQNQNWTDNQDTTNQ